MSLFGGGGFGQQNNQQPQGTGFGGFGSNNNTGTGEFFSLLCCAFLDFWIYDAIVPVRIHRPYMV